MDKAKRLSKVLHTINPVYDSRSTILILGTMPSPKSREQGFYYAHPQNRFWDVLAELFHCEKFVTIAAKTDFLHSHGIALWDVLKSCEIDGAADGSIRNPVPNDINIILSAAPVEAVFTTGLKAYELYNRHCLPETKFEALRLPSTSPANRRLSHDALIDAYSVILNYLR